MLDSVIRKKYGTYNVTEISESVQNIYVKFSKFMNTEVSSFVTISPEMQELVVDFFEKIVMTKNHKYGFSNRLLTMHISIFILIAESCFHLRLQTTRNVTHRYRSAFVN